MSFSVTRRWMDPDGDGDPSDGVDGFRLDVAEMVPLGFWRDYRRFVRGINPDAYLVGEVWWQNWPDRIWDPAPWLQGDVFDAVMNYRWFMPTRGFFAATEPSLTAAAYAASLDSLAVGIGQRPRQGDDEPDGEPRYTPVRYRDLQPGRLQVSQLAPRGFHLSHRSAGRSAPAGPRR